jgi:hypothetical protein
MPIIPSTPRELLAVEYTVVGTTTSTAANGAAFGTAWGGSFDVASRTNVEISVQVPYIQNSATEWTGVVPILDGSTNLGVRLFWSWVAGMPHAGLHGVWRVSGLSAGTHTIAINGKVGAASTGTITCTATDKGLLVVREV